MFDRKDKRVSEGSSSPSFKSIYILGGKNIGNNVELLNVAKELGQTLAVRGIKLVYGGGLQGLRGCAATTALIKGGEVLSVTLPELNPIYFTVGTEVKVSSLPKRLEHMFSNIGAFIAFPGSLGTLSEIFNIAYWSNIHFYKKPLRLLNNNCFYDSLLAFLDHAVEQGMMSPMAHRTILSASTVDQLIDLLQAQALAPDPSMKPPNHRRRIIPDINLG